LRACEAVGVEPRFEELDFISERAAIYYMVSMNINRRHLNPGQRAMLAQALRPMLEPAAQERQAAGRAEGQKVGRRGKDAKPPSRIQEDGSAKSRGVADELAQALNVSHDTISKARKVAREAPELAAKVRSGEISLNAAVAATKAPATQHAPRDVEAAKRMTADMVLEWIEDAPIADVGRVWSACDARIGGTTSSAPTKH
jgi:hypothetical protein